MGLCEDKRMTDFEKRLDEAAEQAFASESMREGFRVGARWARGYAPIEIAPLMDLVKLWEKRNAENTAEIERLSQLYRNKSDQVIRFSNENARLREALAFYADAQHSWKESDDEVSSYSRIDSSDLSEETWAASWGDVKCMVGGKRARDALKGE